MPPESESRDVLDERLDAQARHYEAACNEDWAKLSRIVEAQAALDPRDMTRQHAATAGMVGALFATVRTLRARVAQLEWKLQQ